MHAPASKAHTASSAPSAIEVAALVVASLVGVAALAWAFAGQVAAAAPAPMEPLVVGLAIMAIGAAGVVAATLVRASRQRADRLEAEVERLERQLAATQSIIHAEPQVLIHWEPGQPLTVVCHTVTTVAGLPDDAAALLRFGDWLKPRAAAELKTGLDALFTEGTPFTLILETAAAGYFEAEGRTAGGRAVLRLCDVVGYKRDLARILDRHQTLKSDIDAARALFDALPSPVWFRSADGRLRWVNAAYRAAVEAADTAEVCHGQIELIEARQRQAIARHIGQREVYRQRLDVRFGPDRRPHDVVVLPGDRWQAAAALDVTAVAEARGEIDRRNAAFERTLDRVSTAVAIFAPDRSLAYFNEAYRRLTGLDLVWLRSRPSESSVLDRLRETGRLPETKSYRDWRAKFLARMRASRTMEETWHLPDGRTLEVVAESRDDGGVIYLYTDKTEALAQERLFHQQLRTQRETLDSLEEGVAVFGTDGRLRFNNRTFALLWGLPEALFEAKAHISEVIMRASLRGGEAERWNDLKAAVAGFVERRDRSSGTMTRADQSLVAYNVVPLPDGGTLLTFTDITDAKRYERLLEERNEALIAADRLKTRFISHVSYELRTPMTTIIGFSEMLSSPLLGTLNPKQREYLGDISSSSTALLALVDNILDLATIDAGALQLRPGPVSVARVIDDAIEGVRDRALQARLTFDIGLSDDSTEFVADEARVRQVLFNLIANAVGFSRRADTILISAWREAGCQMFAVEDHGAGIPPEHLPRIFERFESLTRGSTHRGAGLGLSIVKSLVDLHGGTVSLTSEVGQGTRVLVAFPLVPQTAGVTTEAATPPSAAPALGGTAA